MPTANDTIKLEVNLQQLNIILLALGNRPWQEVNDCIIDVRNQVQRQLQPQGDNVAQMQRVKPDAS